MKLFEGKYVILNGETIKQERAMVHIEHFLLEKSIHYCETMHGNGGKIQFFDEHLDLISKICKKFNFVIPECFKNNFKILRKEIEKLIHKNRLFQGVVVKIYLIHPRFGHNNQNSPMNFYITVDRIENDWFAFSDNGLKLDFFDKYKKQQTEYNEYDIEFQNYKFAAGFFINANKLDDCFILNENGNIVETLDSNVFVVKNSAVFTPEASEGCVKRVIREKIIDTVIQSEIKMMEVSTITPQVLLSADEILLANPVYGLRWVGAVRQRRYFNKIGKFLLQKLNEMTFEN